MGAHSTDIFGPVEEGGNNGENVEKEEEWEEQEREEDSSSSEKEGEVEDDEPDYDLWSPLRQTKSSKKPTWKISNGYWIGEKPNTMPRMPLSISFYL